jgi:hypothetical protein
MDTEDNLQASKDSLRELLRDVSVVQAQQYFDDSPVTLVSTPVDHSLGQVLTRYIATVLLTCDELRVVLKVHFNPEQIRAYRQPKGFSGDDLSDKQLIDFMKELSNQMGGRVCRIFDAHQIAMGMSIPTVHARHLRNLCRLPSQVGRRGQVWRLLAAERPV